MEWIKVSLDTERGRALKQQLEEKERAAGNPLIPPTKRMPWMPVSFAQARANKAALDASHGIVKAPKVKAPKVKTSKEEPQPRKKRGVNSDRG
jgi:hypothetical protein